MKEGIHPEYLDAKVVCACGAAYQMRSTRGNFSVEVCANCHPFYTGKQKALDTKGRVDRFQRKYAKNAPAASKAPEAKASEEKAPVEETPESLSVDHVGRALEKRRRGRPRDGLRGRRHDGGAITDEASERREHDRRRRVVEAVERRLGEEERGR